MLRITKIHQDGKRLLCQPRVRIVKHIDGVSQGGCNQQERYNSEQQGPLEGTLLAKSDPHVSNGQQCPTQEVDGVKVGGHCQRYQSPEGPFAQKR